MKLPAFWHTLDFVRRVALAGLFSVVLILSALASFALWWNFWSLHTAADPIAPGWPARVRVLAGDGVAGFRDGRAWQARFSAPFGVAAASDGTVFVTDAGTVSRVRRISPDGDVTTIAGESAHLSTPSALALDRNGGLYVADTGNNAIRRITADGQVSTFAGDGVAGHRDGPAHEARFNGPIGVVVDASNRVIVADTYNDRIRIIDPDGTVRTLAGSGVPGALDGPALEARFHTPSGVASDASGNVYVADTGNGLVRVIDASGVVSTPSWAAQAPLSRPIGVAVAPNGDVYVTDERGRIVEAPAAGPPRILAGSIPGFRDGPGIDARFRSPAGVALVEAGHLIVADSGNALVRVVAAPSRHRFRLPPAAHIDPHFDAEAFGFEPLLWPVAPIEGPHEIAGTIGEARGGEGSERLHAGIDIRADQGTFVRAVRPGIVTSPIAINDFGSIVESLHAGPLSYIHIRAGRDRSHDVIDPDKFVPTFENGKLVGMRVKRGSRFAVGDPVGTVNAFNHVHLNVGWPGEEMNPLVFKLVQFEDSIPPTIAAGGVHLYDRQGQPLKQRVRGRVLVSGAVQIVVDAWDQADGNRPSRRLGLFDMGYQVLHADGTPVDGFENIRWTMRFDRFTLDSDPARLVYAPGSGIPYYRGRRTRFLYVVTNTLHDGVATEGYWDASELPPGDYIVRVWAHDIRGNTATANRDLPVTIGAADAPAGYR